MRIPVVGFRLQVELRRRLAAAGLGRMGAEPVFVEDWTDVEEITKTERGGLVLADFMALIGLWPGKGTAVPSSPARPLARSPARPLARSPARPPGWYVVAVREEPSPRLDPNRILELRAWGVAEHCVLADLLEETTLRRLMTRTAFEVHGARLREALLKRVGLAARDEVEKVVDATLMGIARGDFTVETLASRMHMSKSTLGRHMRQAGLIAPQRFIQRTRVILAVLLRIDPARRAQTWRILGFSSPGHLASRVRSHLGCSLGDLGVGIGQAFPDLVDGLLE
jgi:AraC-like DNA-binding protein